MTWTYVPASLASNDLRTIIRMRLGDTVNAGHVLEDEEIDFVIGEQSSDPTACLLECWKKGLAVLAKQIDTGGAGIQTSRSQRFSQWKDLGLEIRMSALAGTSGTIITEANLETLRDSEAVADVPFSVGMDRYPGR